MNPYKIFADPTRALLTFATLEEARAQLNVRSFQLGAYGGLGLKTAEMLKGKLMLFNERYSAGYETYSKIVRAARQSAQDKQQWIDILIGVGIGVSAGLLAEALVAEATLSTLATVAVEATVETVEAGAAVASKRIIPQAPGQNLEPTGVHPSLVSSKIWERLARLYKDVVVIYNLNQWLPVTLGNIEYAIAQFNLINRELKTEMNAAELMDFSTDLVEMYRILNKIDLSRQIAAMQKIQTQASQYKVPRPQKIEQDIWLYWMASISNSNSGVLDIDDIEDHLEKIEVLGGDSSRCRVDFGRWTSTDDEQEAIQAAKREVRQIEDAYHLIK